MSAVQPATPARPGAPAASPVATFLRHQSSAVFVTLLDFTVMTLLFKVGHTSAVLATVVGAATGGLTNFVLGRRWIFAATEGSAHPQALRYALVSGASLVLNAAGEYVLHDLLGWQFQLARAAVATLVSLAWNYPLHRFFVFPVPPAPPQLSRSLP